MDEYQSYINGWLDEINHFGVESEEFRDASRNLSPILDSIAKLRDTESKRSTVINDSKTKEYEARQKDRELNLKATEINLKGEEIHHRRTLDKQRLEHDKWSAKEDRSIRARDIDCKERGLDCEKYRIGSDLLKSIIGAGASLMMITKIMDFEQTGVIATKALGFVPKIFTRL